MNHWNKGKEKKRKRSTMCHGHAHPTYAHAYHGRPMRWCGGGAMLLVWQVTTRAACTGRFLMTGTDQHAAKYTNILQPRHPQDDLDDLYIRHVHYDTKTTDF